VFIIDDVCDNLKDHALSKHEPCKIVCRCNNTIINNCATISFESFLWGWSQGFKIGLQLTVLLRKLFCPKCSKLVLCVHQSTAAAVPATAEKQFCC